MRRFCFPSNAPAGATVSLLVAAVFLLSPAAFSRGTAEKLERASQYYNEAEKALLALQELPAEQRSQKGYEKVIQAFRRVYQTAPSSPKTAKSLITVGEVYQVMAHNLGHDPGKEKYFASAAEAYDFLLQQYPHSKYQADALLAAARIYHSNLKQPEEALKRFELFLQKYPASPQASEARLAVSDIQTEMASRKTEEPKPKTEEPKTAARLSAPEQPENRSVPSGDLVPVTDIRQWVTPASTRVVINLEEEVKYEVGRLENPPRIYVDLHGAKINRAVARKTVAVDGGLIKRVRVAQHKLDVTRVVMEMDKLTDYSVFDLPNPYRLVIDIRTSTRQEHAPAEPIAASNEGQVAPAGPFASLAKTGKEAPPPQTTGPIPPIAAAVEKAIAGPVAEKVQPVRDKEKGTGEKGQIAGPVSARGRLARPSGDGAASEPAAADKAVSRPIAERVQTAQPNRDGTRSLTRALGLKIGRIILDPGHGGHDTGTIGPSGFYEKDLVLDVALRLGKLISERLGSEVVYTREDDTFIPLESRTSIANEKQADLFLSIHANSSQSQRARGVETYYLSFATDPEALEVAARENAVSQESIHELQDLVKKIALHEKVDESREFASDVQSALIDRLSKGSRPRKDRGVKKAPFMVLVGARMPSVLAEISFLSNPQEETLLRTKTHRQKIAEALYAGIKSYTDTLSGVKVARTENMAAAAPK